MRGMLLGAIAMGFFVAGLFFIRFWKETSDRFFLFFAVAFWLESINRVLLGTVKGQEDVPLYFLIRLLSFSLILFAIIDKNRPKKN